MENTIYHYSVSYENKSFDERNLNKPISELSLEDINWSLRNRYYLHQILDLVLIKIEDNWQDIDQYYPSRICQWYDEAIREIITIPFEFWEGRVILFEKLQGFLRDSNKRPLKVDKSIIDSFLNYKPKEINWTKADSDEFMDNIGYAIGLDIAGNLIEAIDQIKKIKYALMYGQKVYIEPAYKSISSEDELYEFIRDEYSEIGKDLIEDQIIESLKKERTINVANNK